MKVRAMMLVAALAPAALGAQQPAPPPQPRLTVEAHAPRADPDAEAESLDYGEDAGYRMVLPVSVSGAGPFRFVVDTGAERTSISLELAENLRLASSGRATVHSMTEVVGVDTFLVPTLRFGSRELNGVRAPAFRRVNLGADGMLGADALQSQRVIFDFGRREISIAPSARHAESWPNDTIVITARRRHGRLILVDAMVEGHRVWVVLDTGSEITIANPPLQRLLVGRTRGRPVEDVVVHSVTGGQMTVRYTMTRELQLGGATVRQLPIAFADAEPFRQLDLNDRPAILLGMDTLRLFERVSVDFGNRRVRLMPPRGTPRDRQPIWRRVF